MFTPFFSRHFPRESTKRIKKRHPRHPIPGLLTLVLDPVPTPFGRGTSNNSNRLTPWTGRKCVFFSCGRLDKRIEQAIKADRFGRYENRRSILPCLQVPGKQLLPQLPFIFMNLKPRKKNPAIQLVERILDYSRWNLHIFAPQNRPKLPQKGILIIFLHHWFLGAIFRWVSGAGVV